MLLAASVHARPHMDAGLYVPRSFQCRAVCTILHQTLRQLRYHDMLSVLLVPGGGGGRKGPSTRRDSFPLIKSVVRQAVE